MNLLQLDMLMKKIEFLLDSDSSLWYYRRSSMRGGAVAARRAHNPKVAGSSPAPATEKKDCEFLAVFFLFVACKLTLRKKTLPDSVTRHLCRACSAMD